MIELAVQGRVRKGNRVFIAVQLLEPVIACIPGMMGTYPDALSAVNTIFMINHGFAVSDPDGLGGTALNTVDASRAQLRIHADGMIKLINHGSQPPV